MHEVAKGEEDIDSTIREVLAKFGDTLRSPEQMAMQIQQQQQQEQQQAADYKPLLGVERK